MKSTSILGLLWLTLLLLVGCSQSRNEVVLFDGKTFDGWEGPMESFRIKDGSIVAGTLKADIPKNQFLSTKQAFGDFELRLKFKMVGEKVNAGVQFRTKRIPDHHEVIGYQADMGGKYWGALYDESRRRKVLSGPDLEEVMKVVKHQDWNEYVIRAEGARIQLWLNGMKTVDFTEADDTIERSGVVALQVHSGGPMEAWYKDIVLKEL
ncbi:MAG TPA: DUF1080 domain-containing protein [Opitutae bacterium]|nr:hypothetical protein [Opitutaceae bacterium]HCR29939.1 DUF1080 domain-containing protein [Opitutae bacterium]|tara:strand:- start:304 stop:927 length:624 start_codon:yes stop_codon:yes gene_type:complete